MNKRQIILDFTPLLDVVMILLFAFIISAGADVAKANDKAAEEIAQAQSEAAEAAEEAEELREALDSANGQIAEMAEKLEKATPTAVSQNVLALEAFEEGMTLTANIVMTDNVDGRTSWELRLSRGDDFSEVITDGDSIADEIRRAMVSAGYESKQTVLCEIYYRSTDNGSKAALTAVRDAFEQVRKDYDRFYCAERDLLGLQD